MWADELAVARIGKYMDVCLLIYKNCAKKAVIDPSYYPSSSDDEIEA
jgi:hypothetical protein